MGWEDVINDESISLDLSNIEPEQIEAKLGLLPDEEVDELVAALRKATAEANSRKAIINTVISVARVAAKIVT
jgi:hypothetical protein